MTTTKSEKAKMEKAESELREFLKTASDWEMQSTNVPNVFVAKLPTKDGVGTLCLAIQPIGDNGQQMTRKALYIRSESVLDAYSGIFGGKNEKLYTLQTLCAKINGSNAKGRVPKGGIEI